jgi:hypothetical protein
VVVAVGLAVVVDKVLGPLEEAEDLLFGLSFFFGGGGRLRQGRDGRWERGRERGREGERGECVERGEALRKEKEKEGNKGDEREGGMN